MCLSEFCRQPLLFSVTALHGLETPKSNPLAQTFLLILRCSYCEYSVYNAGNWNNFFKAKLWFFPQISFLFCVIYLRQCQHNSPSPPNLLAVWELTDYCCFIPHLISEVQPTLGHIRLSVWFLIILLLPELSSLLHSFSENFHLVVCRIYSELFPTTRYAMLIP